MTEVQIAALLREVELLRRKVARLEKEVSDKDQRLEYAQHGWVRHDPSWN